MDVACAMDLYTWAMRDVINRVQKYKGLHSLGDLTLCGCITIDPFVITRDPSDSSRVFSVEKPTPSDFVTFKMLIMNLTSHTLHLPQRLGAFISQPHRPDNWFINSNLSELYRLVNSKSYHLFCQDSTSRVTRHGTKFLYHSTVHGLCDCFCRASVLGGAVGDAQGKVQDAALHSTAPVYLTRCDRRSFIEKIQALPNQSLWRTLQLQLET